VSRVAELERTQRQEDVDAEHKPTGAGSPSYVWRRNGGEWLIVVNRTPPSTAPMLGPSG
jgi:hypothetical protein